MIRLQIESDFHSLYPDKTNIFTTQWKNFSEAILKLAYEKADSKKEKEEILMEFSVNEGNIINIFCTFQII